MLAPSSEELTISVATVWSLSKKSLIFLMYREFETEIIAASIRNPLHVTHAARIGCDIATVPFNVIMQMTKHPLTDIGIERFLKDWEGVPKK